MRVPILVVSVCDESSDLTPRESKASIRLIPNRLHAKMLRKELRKVLWGALLLVMALAQISPSFYVAGWIITLRGLLLTIDYG